MSKGDCPHCEEEYCFENGVCSECDFTTIDPNNLKCPICGSNVEIRSCCGGSLYSPDCIENDCTHDIQPDIEKVYCGSKEKTLDSWIELCKRMPLEDKWANCKFVFGVNVVPEWGDGEKLHVFIMRKKEWTEEEEYTGDTGPEVYNKMREIGIQQDAECHFSQPEKIYIGDEYKDVEQFSREEILDKLVELGFEYCEDFEKECVELRLP